MKKSPIIKITPVVPGDRQTKRRRRPTKAEIGLRYDMSQFYAMKATLEALFGRPVYMKLKETASIADWRKATTRLLDAIALAIESTVTIADDEWRTDIAAEIAHGKALIKISDTASDLFASLSASLTRIVFLQIGLMPSRTSLQKTAPLNADWWKLDNYRTAQYVQSKQQLEAVFWGEQQRQIGVERQMELHNQYRWSKSGLSYSQWCSRVIAEAKPTPTPP